MPGRFVGQPDVSYTMLHTDFFFFKKAFLTVAPNLHWVLRSMMTTATSGGSTMACLDFSGARTAKKLTAIAILVLEAILQ